MSLHIFEHLLALPFLQFSVRLDVYPVCALGDHLPGSFGMTGSTQRVHVPAVESRDGIG